MSVFQTNESNKHNQNQLITITGTIRVTGCFNVCSFNLLEKELTIRSSLLLQHIKCICTAHWTRLWGKHRLWSCCLMCSSSSHHRGACDTIILSVLTAQRRLTASTGPRILTFTTVPLHAIIIIKADKPSELRNLPACVNNHSFSYQYYPVKIIIIIVFLR